MGSGIRLNQCSASPRYHSRFHGSSELGSHIHRELIQEKINNLKQTSLMKKNLLVAALLVSAVGAFGQGSINFNNRATSGSPAPVVSPIYGQDPNAPTQIKQGNGATYGGGTNQPVPVGTQTYRGAPLTGTGFTIALWGVNVNQSDAALSDPATQPISVGTFRVTTNPLLQGFNQPPAAAPAVPGVIGGTTDRAKFLVRAWDNKGGTILTWDQVLRDPLNIAHGESTIFTVNQTLGLAPSITPPNMVGWESFQLYTVPEPSVIALGVLGAGCLFLLRRRK